MHKTLLKLSTMFLLLASFVFSHSFISSSKPLCCAFRASKSHGFLLKTLLLPAAWLADFPEKFAATAPFLPLTFFSHLGLRRWDSTYQVKKKAHLGLGIEPALKSYQPKGDAAWLFGPHQRHFTLNMLLMMSNLHYFIF